MKIRFFNYRTIFIRVRRSIEFLSILTFFTIIFLFSSRSTPVPTNVVEQIERNSFDLLDHGRPDLKKYVHLDLKGAPPRPNEFYANFFKFLNQLNMGVTGLLIEYEDMLPLQGDLINVSQKTNKSNV